MSLAREYILEKSVVSSKTGRRLVNELVQIASCFGSCKKHVYCNTVLSQIFAAFLFFCLVRYFVSLSDVLIKEYVLMNIKVNSISRRRVFIIHKIKIKYRV